MSTDQVRASVSATLGEIEATTAVLKIGLPERDEILEVVGRIEQQLVSRGIEGDKKWKASTSS